MDKVSNVVRIYQRGNYLSVHGNDGALLVGIAINTQEALYMPALGRFDPRKIRKGLIPYGAETTPTSEISELHRLFLAMALEAECGEDEDRGGEAA